MKLKIALYYPYLYLRSGVERTILEIVKRSTHDWMIFTNHYEPESTYPDFKHLKHKIVELKRISVNRSYCTTLRSAYIIFNQRLPLGGYDLLWIHNEGLGSLINFNHPQLPKICFCHTPLKIIYDERLREHYLRSNGIKIPAYYLFSFLFRRIDARAFRLYDWCFCVSEEVRRRVVGNGLISHDKTEVIYRGVDTKVFQGNGTYEEYFFQPARIKWWKNIELSIGAFTYFQTRAREFSNFKLVIAGELYSGNESYCSKLKKLIGSNSNILLHTNPDEAQMMAYYKNCRAVVSTTLNEDFGLTVLEGLSFAKPVIAMKRGGPKEIIRHASTGFLSAEDKKEYASYMCLLAKDANLAKEMGARGRASIVPYDWSNFVRYLDAFLVKFMGKN